MGYDMPKEAEVSNETVLKAAAVIVKGDLGEQTLVDYLKSLLETLWEEDEQFSGKRPFGNGGWKFDVYAGLIEVGVISGSLDEDGYVDKYDSKEADAVVFAVIKRFVIKG